MKQGDLRYTMAPLGPSADSDGREPQLCVCTSRVVHNVFKFFDCHKCVMFSSEERCVDNRRMRRKSHRCGCVVSILS